MLSEIGVFIVEALSPAILSSSDKFHCRLLFPTPYHAQFLEAVALARLVESMGAPPLLADSGTRTKNPLLREICYCADPDGSLWRGMKLCACLRVVPCYVCSNSN